MKVLILSSGLGSVHRGYERFLLDLAANLRSNGLPVTCWGSSDAEGVCRVPVLRRDELQQLALDRFRGDPRVTSISAPELHDWALHTEEHLFAVSAAACLDEELRAKEPTIVYVKWQEGLVDPGGRSTALLERLVRAGQEGPVCTIIRTDFAYRPIVERLAAQLFVFHSVTPWVTKDLRDMGVAPELIFELPNGVTGEPFHEARARRLELREQYRIPQDAFVILSVGAFDHDVKNFPYVLREIKPLAADPSVYWLVAGSRGAEPTAWEREARAIFGDRFRPLVGVSFERMPDLYGVADLAVCGSLAETFGLVYAETQLSGLPFVMHDYEVTRWMTAGLPAELESASRVDMKKPEALATAVAQWSAVLRDPQGRQALGGILESFRERQAARFSWKSLGPRFAETFRSVSSAEAIRNRGKSFMRRVAAGTHARGIRFVQDNKPAEALPFLAAALRAEETSERWNDWATCQVTSGRYAEGEQGYRRAIELDPQNAEALANLAVLLVNQKRHREAVPFLERAVAIPNEKQDQPLRDLLALCKRICGPPPPPPAPGPAPAGAPSGPFRALSSGPLRILVIHETLLQTDCGGADVRLMQIVCALRALGHEVTFVARLGLRRERYEPPLKAVGATVYVNDAERLRFIGVDMQPEWSFEHILKVNNFDVAILYHWFWTGPSVAEHYVNTIRRVSPETRVAVLSDDRHGLREMQMARLTHRITDVERAKDFESRETEVYRHADIVLGITQEDFAEFHRVTPDLLTQFLPMVAEKCPAGPGPGKRKHLLFLGSFSNLANRDGLDWFLARVWPRVRQRLANVELRLAGSSMPDSFRAPGNGIVGLGHVGDMARVFAQYRVFVSPIRYGTGIKTKNVAALAHGIPIVTSTIGAEGIQLCDGETVSIADDEDAFVEAVVRLYQDDALWRRRAKAGREHMLKNFSSESLATHVQLLIERLRTLRPQAFDPGHTPSYQLVEQAFPEVLTHLPRHERPGVRLVAYVHLGERFLAEGDPRRALAQFRHAFHYLRGGLPNVSIFGRLFEGLERSYRELGDAEGIERCARHRLLCAGLNVPEPAVEVENRGAIGESAKTLEPPSVSAAAEQLSEALP